MNLKLILEANRKDVARRVQAISRHDYIDPRNIPESRKVLVYEYRTSDDVIFYSGYSTIGNAGMEDDYVTMNLDIVLPPPGYVFQVASVWTNDDAEAALVNDLKRTVLSRLVFRHESMQESHE